MIKLMREELILPDIGVIRIGDLLALHKNHTGRVRFMQVGTLTGAGHVMGALDDGLHPAQTSVARRTDLRGAESLRRKFEIGIAAAMEKQFPFAPARANGFAFPNHVDEVVVDCGRTFSKLRIAGALDPDAIEQTHAGIHLVAKIGGVRGFDGFELFDNIGTDVVRQLSRDLCLPFRRKTFRIQWRKLFLDLVSEMEIEGVFGAGALFAQKSDRLTRVVIAVVKKENDLATDLAVKPASGHDLRVKKSLRKETARLLTETNDRRAHDAATGAGSLFRKTVDWSSQAKIRTATQPMKLYQR